MGILKIGLLLIATTFPLGVSEPLIFPVAGKDSSAIRGFFGDCRSKCRRSHKGVDIFAPAGTNVVAVTSGVISKSAVSVRGGKGLWLQDEEGVSYYYAHLKTRLAKKGDTVFAGQIIGKVGNTGNARYTKSHLHFEIYKKRRAVNPYPILTRKYEVPMAREPNVVRSMF